MQGDPAWTRDLCASFQRAVTDVLVRKAVQAAALTHVPRLAASGGVLCNASLRGDLAAACAQAGIEFIVADPAFCTDNAAMIAGTAALKLEAGLPASVGDDINPNLDLFSSQPDGDFARSLGKALKIKNRQSQKLGQERPVGAAGEIGIA
jgi:N6-L-threonylcarbamoyladenine synthase